MRSIFGLIRLSLCIIAFLIPSILWMPLGAVLGIIALILPFKKVRTKLFDALEFLSECWLGWQAWIVRHLLPTQLDIISVGGLSPKGRYILLSNHQSIADPFILMAVFHKQIPFSRYFAKIQVLMVPLINAGAYFMHFPLLRRYSPAALAKNPNLREKDINSIKRLSDHFKDRAFSLVSFVEGTRKTAAKYAAQKSPYQHLLRPKAGGLAVFLSNFSGPIDGILDVSMVYSTPVNFFQFLSGKLPKITVHIRKLDLPAELRSGDYVNDPDYRQAFKAWIENIWQEKDKIISEILLNSKR